MDCRARTRIRCKLIFSLPGSYSSEGNRLAELFEKYAHSLNKDLDFISSVQGNLVSLVDSKVNFFRGRGLFVSPPFFFC